MEEFFWELIALLIKVIVEELKNFFDILKSIATIGGIILGGFWTYLLFVKQRLNYPRVNLELEIDDILLSPEKRLVHAAIKICNIGNIIFNSDYAEIRLLQIVPIHEKISEIVKDMSLVEKDQGEVKWPEIDDYIWEWDTDSLEIEPGESDTVHADFMISKDIQTVQFYFYIRNTKKTKKDLAWPLTENYEFKQKTKPTRTEDNIASY